MKENQFTYLQLVYSRVIHYSSIPIKKIQTLIIHQNPKKIHVWSIPIGAVHKNPSYFHVSPTRFTQLLPSRTTHPSSVGGERKRAKMNGRDNSGMQSHARNRALPSPFPWYVRLVTESFRETTEGRGNLARLCSHNRTRITARDGGGMGEKNSRSIIHTRDGRCWFSFDLCCATPLGRPCQSMRACAALPDGRRGSGGDPRGKQLSNISVGNNRSAVPCRAPRYWMMGKRKERIKGDVYIL